MYLYAVQFTIYKFMKKGQLPRKEQPVVWPNNNGGIFGAENYCWFLTHNRVSRLTDLRLNEYCFMSWQRFVLTFCNPEIQIAQFLVGIILAQMLVDHRANVSVNPEIPENVPDHLRSRWIMDNQIFGEKNLDASITRWDNISRSCGIWSLDDSSSCRWSIHVFQICQYNICDLCPSMIWYIVGKCLINFRWEKSIDFVNEYTKLYILSIGNCNCK